MKKCVCENEKTHCKACKKKLDSKTTEQCPTVKVYIVIFVVTHVVRVT